MQRAKICNTSKSSCASYSDKSCMDHSIEKLKYKQDSTIHRKHHGKIITLKNSGENKLLHELCWSKAVEDIRNEIFSENNSGVQLISLSKLKNIMHHTREMNSTEKSMNLMNLKDDLDKEMLLKHKRKRSYCSCCSCSTLQAQSYYIKQQRSKYGKGYQHCTKRSLCGLSTICKGKNKMLCLKVKPIKSDPCTYISELKRNLKQHSGKIILEFRPKCQKFTLEQPLLGTKSAKKYSKNVILSKKSDGCLTESKAERNRLSNKLTAQLEEKVNNINGEIGVSKHILRNDNKTNKINIKTKKCTRTKYLSYFGILPRTVHDTSECQKFDNKLNIKHSLIRQSSWRKNISDLSWSLKSDSDIHFNLISKPNLKKLEVFSRHVYDSENIENLNSENKVGLIQSFSCDLIDTKKAASNKKRVFQRNITSFTDNSRHIISNRLCESRLSYEKKYKCNDSSTHNLRNDSTFHVVARMQQNKFLGLQEKVDATNKKLKPVLYGVKHSKKITELPTNLNKKFARMVSISNQNKEVNKTEISSIITDKPKNSIETIDQETATYPLKIDQMQTISTSKHIISSPSIRPVIKMTDIKEDCKETYNSLISLNCSKCNTVSLPYHFNYDSRNMMLLRYRSLADFISNTSISKRKPEINSDISVLPISSKILKRKFFRLNSFQKRRFKTNKYRQQVLSTQTHGVLFNKQFCKTNKSRIGKNNLLKQHNRRKNFPGSNNEQTLNFRVCMPDLCNEYQKILMKNIVKESPRMLFANIKSRTFSIPTFPFVPTPTKPNKKANMMIVQSPKKRVLQPLSTKSFDLGSSICKSAQPHDAKPPSSFVTNDSCFLRCNRDVIIKSECKENGIKSILKRYLLKSKVQKMPKLHKGTQYKPYKNRIGLSKLRYAHTKGIGVVGSSSNVTAFRQSLCSDCEQTKSNGYAVKTSGQYTHASVSKNISLRPKLHMCSTSFNREFYKPRIRNKLKSEFTFNESCIPNKCQNRNRYAKYKYLINENKIKARKIYSHSFVNISAKSRAKQDEDRNIYTVLPVLLPYECEPGICVPGECDPYECYKRMKKRQTSQLSGTEKPTRRTFGSSASGPLYKATKSQAVTELSTKRHRRSSYAKQDTKIHHTKTIRYGKDDSYDSIVRVGSSISFNIEFYKSTGVAPDDVPEPPKITQSHKTKVKTRRSVVRPSRQHKKIHMPKTPLRHHKLQTGETVTKGTGVSRLKKSLATVALQKNEQLSKCMNVCMEGKLPIRREIGISKDESFPLYKEVGVSTRRYTPVDAGIKIRRIKDIGTKPFRPPHMSVSNMTCMDPTCCSTGVEPMLYGLRKDIAITTMKPLSHYRRVRFLPKGLTRFGSNVTLNVEFYKERVGDIKTDRSNYVYRPAVQKRGIATIETDKRDASVKWIPQVQSRHTYTKSVAGYSQQCQAECSTSTGIGTATGMGTFLKRCFCTLNLSRKRRVSQSPEYDIEPRPSVNDKYVPTKTCDRNTCDAVIDGSQRLNKTSLANNKTMTKRCFCTRKFFKNKSKHIKSKSKVVSINRVSVPNAWNGACNTNPITYLSKSKTFISSTQCKIRKGYECFDFNQRFQFAPRNSKKAKNKKTDLKRKQNIRIIYKKTVPKTALVINKTETCFRRELNKSQINLSNNKSNIIKTFLEKLRIRFRSKENPLVSSKNINTDITRIPKSPLKLNYSNKMHIESNSQRNFNIDNSLKIPVSHKENKISKIVQNEKNSNRKSFHACLQSGDEFRKFHVKPNDVDQHNSQYQFIVDRKEFPYLDYKIIQMALVHENKEKKKKVDGNTNRKEIDEIKSNKNQKIQTVKGKNIDKLKGKKADKNEDEVANKKPLKNKKEIQDKVNKDNKEVESKKGGKNKKEPVYVKSDMNKKETEDKISVKIKKLIEATAGKAIKEVDDKKVDKNKKEAVVKKKNKSMKEIVKKAGKGCKEVRDRKADKNKERTNEKVDKNKKDIDVKNKNELEKDDKAKEDMGVNGTNMKQKRSGKETKSVITSGKDKVGPKSKPQKGTKEMNTKTCSCKSQLCYRELKQLKLKSKLKKDTCVCGGPIFTYESKKRPGPTCQCNTIMEKRLRKEKQSKERNESYRSQEAECDAKKQKTKSESKKRPGTTCQCNTIMEKRLRKEKQRKERDELYRRQEAECDAKRQKAKLLAEKKHKQKQILKLKGKKEDKKQAEKFKKLDDGTLIAESIVDTVKSTVGVGVSAVKGITRAIFNPKCTYYEIRRAFQQPVETVSRMQHAVTNSDISAAAKRIKNRTNSMASVRKLKNIFNIRKPAKRVNVKRERKKPLRKRVRQDFECSLFMASLRRRPCLFVYNQCPWCYPQCLSFLYAWRQCVDIFLFLLAVGVWSPFILAMETCRALMCCFFCTG